MNGPCPLTAWKSGIGRSRLFVGSDAHARELDALAYAAHRLGKIDRLELAEMLEMVEAAEMWAALEMDENELRELNELADAAYESVRDGTD